MARERLSALRFPNELVDAVTKLVELHLRFHRYGRMGWTDSAVRRYVRDAGPLLDQLNATGSVRSDSTRATSAGAGVVQAWTTSRRASKRLNEQEELATPSSRPSTGTRSWRCSTSRRARSWAGVAPARRTHGARARSEEDARRSCCAGGRQQRGGTSSGDQRPDAHLPVVPTRGSRPGRHRYRPGRSTHRSRPSGTRVDPMTPEALGNGPAGTRSTSRRRAVIDLARRRTGAANRLVATLARGGTPWLASSMDRSQRGSSRTTPGGSQDPDVLGVQGRGLRPPPDALVAEVIRVGGAVT